MNHNTKREADQKQEILIYAIEFADLEQTKKAFEAIRLQDVAFNRPFGYGKLKFHGPDKIAKGYRVWATVRMFVDKYIRKCAYSYSEQIRKMCINFVKEFFPNNCDYTHDIFEQADIIKALIVGRKKVN